MVVKLAYSHAEARLLVYVKCPLEEHSEGMCGRVDKAYYGTRDAAQRWEFDRSECLVSLGFIQAMSAPCMFYHPTRYLRIVVHGDGLTVLSTVEVLDWLHGCIVARLEVKFRGRFGPSAENAKNRGILNRVVGWTDGGLNYEADERHAEMTEQLGIEMSSKSVSISSASSNDDETEINVEKASMYRLMVARANCLSQDRGDNAFDAKEWCRREAQTRNCDLRASKGSGGICLITFVSLCIWNTKSPSKSFACGVTPTVAGVSKLGGPPMVESLCSADMR